MLDLNNPWPPKSGLTRHLSGVKMNKRSMRGIKSRVVKVAISAARITFSRPDWLIVFYGSVFQVAWMARSAMSTVKPFLYSIDDFENHAIASLPKVASDYFNGGSLDGATLRSNRMAFQKYYVQPRALRDVSEITTRRKVFRNDIPFPVGIAPAAMQKMAHADGELATARGCGTFGTVMGLSTFSTTALEDVKSAADSARDASGRSGDSECVLQLYVFVNRETTEKLVRRAEGVCFP